MIVSFPGFGPTYLEECVVIIINVLIKCFLVLYMFSFPGNILISESSNMDWMQLMPSTCNFHLHFYSISNDDYIFQFI